ncbi:MAG TPA: IS66 family insertion sequence element accessory protein TnpB [Planctomycetaceae bacterium]|jgi:transposase|nr:IS66 family insertion sequence element accessory protein TnpB [Planctomycetaceae bacterium]
MITLPHSVRVFLHAPATDLRKGFDALCGLVTTAFDQDPLSGHLFLFVNRRRDRLKILFWDRDGLAIWYKRLESPGTFQLPAVPHDAVSIEMTATQLALILSGIDLRSARQRKRYERPMPQVQKSTATLL